MYLSQRSHEGYLMVDHRASPGLTEEQAVMLGYGAGTAKTGIFETHTLGCHHCGMHVVMNPDRQRQRGFCSKCNRYICDWCDAARLKPDYVHRSITELADLVQSGKFESLRSLNG